MIECKKACLYLKPHNKTPPLQQPAVCTQSPFEPLSASVGKIDDICTILTQLVAFNKFDQSAENLFMCSNDTIYNLIFKAKCVLFIFIQNEAQVVQILSNIVHYFL